MTNEFFDSEKQPLRNYYIFSEQSIKILDELIEECRREIFKEKIIKNEEQD